MSDSLQLGDLQLAIMRVLWKKSEATVAEVHESLFSVRGLALTTIATMLRKMEDKGVVEHRADGRVFIYQATIAERDVHKSMVSKLTSQLFQGDAVALVSHLITEKEIDEQELVRLQQLIAEKKNTDNRGDTHV